MCLCRNHKPRAKRRPWWRFICILTYTITNLISTKLTFLPTSILTPPLQSLTRFIQSMSQDPHRYVSPMGFNNSSKSMTLNLANHSHMNWITKFKKLMILFLLLFTWLWFKTTNAKIFDQGDLKTVEKCVTVHVVSLDVVQMKVVFFDRHNFLWSAGGEWLMVILTLTVWGQCQDYYDI